MASIRYIEDNNNQIVLPITHERGVIDSQGVNLETKLSQKQQVLVSGANIKTINSQSILGEGNIVIEGGGDVPENCESTDNKVNTISDASTTTQYPSATAVSDYVAGLEDFLGDIDSVLNPIEEA